MEVEKRHVEDRGIAREYFFAGRGEASLLAFAGSLGACETLARVLSQAAPDHRIIAPAYPVVGDIREMFGVVDRILAAESTRPDAVYGSSFGGILAQEWMRRHPAGIRHAILSGCGAPDPDRGRANRKWLNRLPLFPMPVVRAGLRLALKRMMRDVVQNRDAWRRDYAGLIAGTQRADLAMRYRISIDFDANCVYSPSDLQAWNGRILILEGEADKVASPKTRESLRRIYPGARVHGIPRAGHSLLLTHTDECVEVIRGFLREP